MITRKPLAKGNATSITFTLPADAATESACVVGSFNDWSDSAHAMKLDKKKGVWASKAIQLKPGRHSFRYLLDGQTWHNDEAADGTEPTPFGSENSVLDV